MRNIESRNYYARLIETYKEKVDELNAKNQRLYIENKHLLGELREKEDLEKSLLQQVEKLEQQYSEGILSLTEAKRAYQSATEDLIAMKKKYVSEFKREMNRIRNK